MDGAGALLERDVIGQNAERIAIEERMAEDGVFDLRAGECRRWLSGSCQPQFLGGDLQQIERRRCRRRHDGVTDRPPRIRISG